MTRYVNSIIIKALKIYLNLQRRYQRKGINMKTRLIASIILLAVFCSFVSCKKTVVDEGDVTVVIENEKGKFEEYKIYLKDVENKNRGVLGVLEAMRDREEHPLSFSKDDDSYKAKITSIGPISQDSNAGKYIAVYTSVETDSYAEAKSIMYGESLLFASGVSVSMMSVPTYCVVLFRLEKAV